MYLRVGNCYVGDVRMVIEMLYSLKINIFLQRPNNKVLLFKTMLIKSLFYLITGIKTVRRKQVANTYLWI